MGTPRIGSTLLVATLLLLSNAVLAWDDPVTATPGVYKVLHETDQVRVLEVTYQPGQRENWHGHPSYLVYVVDPGDGKMRSENAHGEIREFDVQAGEYTLLDPVEKHRGMNPGTVPIRVLAIELKQD